jgi:hypothetical protein
VKGTFGALQLNLLHSRFWLFRLSGGEVLKRKSGRISGFDERWFKGDSTTEEVATQICLSRANVIRSA